MQIFSDIFLQYWKLYNVKDIAYEIISCNPVNWKEKKLETEKNRKKEN